MKSIVITNRGLRADERRPDEILRAEPLKSIPLGDGLHMVVHAKEARTIEDANRAAVSILCHRGQSLRVDGDAVVVRDNDGEVTPADVAGFLVHLMQDGVVTNG